MRPLAAAHEKRKQGWGSSGRREWPPPMPTHPYAAPQPSHPRSTPARAPCHRESLPQKDEHKEEDEEAGGEEQLGWGRKKGSEMAGRVPLSHSTPTADSMLTQDLHTFIANAIGGILTPVDAEKQEAQDWRSNGQRGKGQKLAVGITVL